MGGSSGMTVANTKVNGCVVNNMGLVSIEMPKERNKRVNG